MVVHPRLTRVIIKAEKNEEINHGLKKYVLDSELVSKDNGFVNAVVSKGILS